MAIDRLMDNPGCVGDEIIVLVPDDLRPSGLERKILESLPSARHHEVPFVTRITAEQSTTGLPTMLRGVIDLAFEEQDGWGVVDYKTDAVTEGRLQSLVDHYQGQVATYASVWQAMLGKKVKESGLYFTSYDQYVTA